MADNNNDDDEDTHSKRESHFNHQRSSLRSDSSVPTTRSRPESGQRLYDIRLAERADSDTIASASSPSPVIPFARSRASSNLKSKRKAHAFTSPGVRGKSGPPADDARKLEELLAPESWANPYALLAQPSPIPLHEFNREHDRESWPRKYTQRKSGLSNLGLRAESQLDITALPSMTSTTPSKMDPYARSKPTPTAQRASRIATELYTISYLIFFAIWGTLARLGLQALTFYPGAPIVFSELWANVAGTFIIGFLSEDRSLFAAEWGNRGDKLPEPSDRPADDRGAEKKRHGKVKKTIPLYIGLATGFCGSFTSFSSFIRDVFLSLSNDLKAPIYHPGATSTTSTAPRNDGYSVMAVLATILTTISLCYCALKLGAHFALLIQPITPTLPFRPMRRIVDPLFVFLGWGCWLGAVLLSIFPPHNSWRSQALFALVFAPLGCLLRYYLSLTLNPILSSFPLGTFSVNIFGTAVLGMSYDLQRVPLRYTGVVGGSLIGCQVLQGIEDGFCGALTTVSTWIAELDTLGRKRAYVYGGASVGGGLGLLVCIMGSVRWTVGWEEIICRT